MSDAETKKAADAKRASTRKETIERHSRMQLLVRECRIRPNGKNKRDYLRRLFTEGRWYYNWLLQQYKDGKNKTISSLDTTDEFAVVLAPNGYEVRNLVALSSQMRQSVKKQLNTNHKSLVSNIKAGNCEYGELHYKQSCDQIPLKAGKWANDESARNKAVTFSLNDKRTRVRLQGAGFALRLTGGDQIPRDAELADGKLVRRAGEYYLQVTFFVGRGESLEDEEGRILSSADALSGKSFDFGIEKHVTDESGASESWCFGETERLKAAQEANEAFQKMA